LAAGRLLPPAAVGVLRGAGLGARDRGAVTIQDADPGDTSTFRKTLGETDAQLNGLISRPSLGEAVTGLQEVVMDRGYHSTSVLMEPEDPGLRSHISDLDRVRRRWRDNVDGQVAMIYENRRRILRTREKRLHRRRAELTESSFAHAYETGAMRRTLSGHTNTLKCLLIHLGGFNLALLLRHRFGTDTPRGLPGLDRRLQLPAVEALPRVQASSDPLTKASADPGASYTTALARPLPRFGRELPRRAARQHRDCGGTRQSWTLELGAIPFT
jgi:hypothetical protein